MTLTAGTRLGSYQITGLIGVGGMGEVYKATDTRLDRTVAIKTLSAEIASDPELRQRFEHEAKAISSLNHPRICTLHDIGSHDGVDFLVLEYLEGETLAQRLAHGALPLEEAVRCAIEMADALEAAHERGVVHRDFKPANVTLTPDGIKLLDFGIAKVVAGRGAEPGSNQALTAVANGAVRGAVIGTASYMSPEQVRGMPVDRRTDVWAFGCVLFEMLTGKKAFVGPTAADTTTAILGREPSLEELPTGTPEPVRHVLRRCLEKDAGRRLRDIGDARTELGDALTAMRVTGKGTLESQPSIAVLPFANMSADPENEYFSDGLAEEILNALAQIPRLKVIARTSAFAFKGKNEDIRRIAEALNVTTVLEGSVRTAGNRIRVTAQLIAAADEPTYGRSGTIVNCPTSSPSRTKLRRPSRLRFASPWTNKWAKPANPRRAWLPTTPSSKPITTGGSRRRTDFAVRRGYSSRRFPWIQSSPWPTARSAVTCLSSTSAS